MFQNLPNYDDLPAVPGKPPRSAWGLWGDNDQIGTINLLTPERMVSAARLIRKGATFPLNWELEKPDPPLAYRETLRHRIKPLSPTGNDDVYDNFNTQASSQWDGLSHESHAQYGFYNGVTKAQITGKEGTRNGIEHWARRGIAGRGVLVDYIRWVRENGIAFDPGKNTEITVAQLFEAAKSQNISFQIGDILLFRTGWIEWYETLDTEKRVALSSRPFMSCGLKQADETLRFLWDNHFAAVATDSPGFEVFPVDASFGLMHHTILPLWGMPIGEMFYLDPLAADCAADDVNEFFFASAPLNKLGGVASPPNALAIK